MARPPRRRGRGLGGAPRRREPGTPWVCRAPVCPPGTARLRVRGLPRGAGARGRRGGGRGPSARRPRRPARVGARPGVRRRRARSATGRRALGGRRTGAGPGVRLHGALFRGPGRTGPGGVPGTAAGRGTGGGLRTGRGEHGGVPRPVPSGRSSGAWVREPGTGSGPRRPLTLRVAPHSPRGAATARRTQTTGRRRPRAGTEPARSASGPRAGTGPSVRREGVPTRRPPRRPRPRSSTAAPGWPSAAASQRAGSQRRSGPAGRGRTGPDRRGTRAHVHGVPAHGAAHGPSRPASPRFGRAAGPAGRTGGA